MTTPIDTLRSLAGKNAALMRRANDTQQNLYAAAEQESARLSKLIDGASRADVLTDDNKAEIYQSWVTQRAGLQRLLAEAPQSSASKSESTRS
jgi:hypothetical protein